MMVWHWDGLGGYQYLMTRILSRVSDALHTWNSIPLLQGEPPGYLLILVLKSPTLSSFHERYTTHFSSQSKPTVLYGNNHHIFLRSSQKQHIVPLTKTSHFNLHCLKVKPSKKHQTPSIDLTNPFVPRFYHVLPILFPSNMAYLGAAVQQQLQGLATEQGLGLCLSYPDVS